MLIEAACPAPVPRSPSASPGNIVSTLVAVSEPRLTLDAHLHLAGAQHRRFEVGLLAKGNQPPGQFQAERGDALRVFAP